MRTGLLLIGLVACSAVDAAASEGRTEVGVFLGVSLLDASREAEGPTIALRAPGPVIFPPPPFVFHEKEALEGGILLGFRLGRVVSARASVEATFSVGPSHDHVSESRLECREGPCPLRPDILPRLPDRSVRDQVAVYHYDLGLRYDLLRGEVRPFLAFAVGGVSADTDAGVRTDFALSFGTGVLLDLGRTAMRLELDDHLIVDHFLTGRTEHDVQVRAGLSFRP